MKEWFDLLVVTVASVLIGSMFAITIVSVTELKSEVIELKEEVRQYERIVEQDVSLILKDKEL